MRSLPGWRMRRRWRRARGRRSSWSSVIYGARSPYPAIPIAGRLRWRASASPSEDAEAVDEGVARVEGELRRAGDERAPGDLGDDRAVRSEAHLLDRADGERRAEDALDL